MLLYVAVGVRQMFMCLGIPADADIVDWLVGRAGAVCAGWARTVEMPRRDCLLAVDGEFLQWLIHSLRQVGAARYSDRMSRDVALLCLER